MRFLLGSRIAWSRGLRPRRCHSPRSHPGKRPPNKGVFTARGLGWPRKGLLKSFGEDVPKSNKVPFRSFGTLPCLAGAIGCQELELAAFGTNGLAFALAANADALLADIAHFIGAVPGQVEHESPPKPAVAYDSTSS